MYIVAFIIVLYLSIQLQSCQSVLINLLTYLRAIRQSLTEHVRVAAEDLSVWNFGANRPSCLKTPSTPATMSRQDRRMLQVE